MDAKTPAGADDLSHTLLRIAEAELDKVFEREWQSDETAHLGSGMGLYIAKGIVEALGRVDLRAPIVIRLDGTNAEQGREILSSHESDRLVSKPTMVEAARTAVEMAEARS